MVAGVGITLVVGIAVADRPTLGVAAVAVIVGALALFSLRLRFYPALIVLGLAVVPSVILEGQLHGHLGMTPFSGQARLLSLLALLALIRCVFERPPVRLHGAAAVAIGVFVSWTLFAVLVAYFRGNAYSGLFTDYSRQMTYVLAFVVGAAGAARARDDRRLAQMYRSLAACSLLVSLLCIAYWAWAVFHVPALGRVFGGIASASVYDPTRSAFPFTQDSPNLAAVAIVSLAAFVIPTLAVGGRRDRRLAAVTALAALAAVMATQSRTGLICLMAAAVPFLLTLPRGASRRRIVVVIVALSVIGTSAYTLLPSSRQLSTHASTLLARESIWRQATVKIAESLVLGQGYGYSARGNFVETIPSGPYSAPHTALQSAHSDYVGTLVDGGLIGGIAFGVILLSLARLGFLGLRSLEHRPSSIGFLCVLAGMFVAMIGASVLQSAVNATLLWLFAGIVIGRREVAR